MTEKEIQQRIHELEVELRKLKQQQRDKQKSPATVIVPDEVSDFFESIENKVRAYFDDVFFDPVSGEITVHGQRYVLFRSNSMSVDFMEFIKNRYSDRPESEAISIGNNFLYDNAKVIGKKDAVAFHKTLNLEDPIQKLAAGPIHFAFTGWANVELLPESNPVAGDDYFLKFTHHNSFESKSWIKAGKASETPVCLMNCGYSAGWCEESFEMSLTTVEIECEAQGDDQCTFIMAPTSRIHEYVSKENANSDREIEIPVFFNSIIQEEKLKESLQQKELLIQEIHHRVKNNLQVISSLLKLQMNKDSNEEFRDEFKMSINRVNTMAAVHELLYLQKNFDRIEVESYFRELIKSFILFYTVDHQVKVNVDIEVDGLTIGLDKSIPLALIMNEITCNAYKHAFKDSGNFFLKLTGNRKKLVLEMGDDGPGFDPKKQQQGLGTELIEILCDQLDAELEMDNSDAGLRYKITLPVN